MRVSLGGERSDALGATVVSPAKRKWNFLVKKCLTSSPTQIVTMSGFHIKNANILMIRFAVVFQLQIHSK